MNSGIKGNTGGQGRVVEVCSMESKKRDGPEKTRFLVVRDEIYNRYNVQETNDQVVSSSLKRSITQSEEEGEVIEIDDG